MQTQENVAAVNEALSELYIEDEDHDKLRESVDDYDNFDQVYIVRLVFIVHTKSSLRPKFQLSFFRENSQAIPRKIPERFVLNSRVFIGLRFKFYLNMFFNPFFGN